jgi:hypothetical protein
MESVMLSLLLWLNAHGFATCAGQPEVRRVPDSQTHAYMAWYQDGTVRLSTRFDYDGLFVENSQQRGKLARSALLHELAHHCQAQRDGPINPLSERAWLARENEAYALQTVYLREHGSATVLVWHRGHEDD